MRRLKEQIRRKRPGLSKENSWILFHDNAPSSRAIIVNEFLTKHSTNTIEQPLYSPDMALTIDLVLIDPQSVGKRTHDLMDTVNAKKRWKTICWRVNKYLK
jgi:hypothetical protein